MESNPDVAMLHTAYDIIDKNGNFIEKVPSQGSGQLYQVFLRSCTVALPTVMLRRSLLGSDGNFDEDMTIGEDIDLWIRIAKHHKIGEIQQSLTQISQQDVQKRRDFIKIHSSFLKIIQENRETAPEISNLFWRRLIAHQHNLYGHQLLNTQPEHIGLIWTWFIRGLLQCPFPHKVGR